AVDIAVADIARRTANRCTAGRADRNGAAGWPANRHAARGTDRRTGSARAADCGSTAGAGRDGAAARAHRYAAAARTRRGAAAAIDTAAAAAKRPGIDRHQHDEQDHRKAKRCAFHRSPPVTSATLGWHSAWSRTGLR